MRGSIAAPGAGQEQRRGVVSFGALLLPNPHLPRARTLWLRVMRHGWPDAVLAVAVAVVVVAVAVKVAVHCVVLGHRTKTPSVVVVVVSVVVMDRN